MGLGAQRAIRPLAVHIGAHHQPQHPSRFLIKFAGREFSLIDELTVGLCHIIVVIGIGSAHGESVGPGAELQVESVFHRLKGVVRTTPVADHHAVEAPLLFQDAVEQHLVMAVVLILIEVVGPHDSPGATLGDSGMEGRQVDFAKRAVADDDVDLMTVFLVVVERVVLHAGRHPFRLQSLHIGNYHARGQPWILAHILEVASVERGAVDVDARSEHHILVAVERLLAQAFAIGPGEARVPRGGEACECREGHARVVGLSGLLPLVPKHVGTHAMRSVIGPEVGEAETFHTCRREFRLSMDDGDFLVERHASERVLHPRLDVFRLIEVDELVEGLRLQAHNKRREEKSNDCFSHFFLKTRT